MSAVVAIVAGAAALAAALLAVTAASILRALIAMAGALVALAVAFFALGAGFAGALQIVVYVGAIVVVFVFAISTLDLSEERLAKERGWLRRAWPVAGAVCGLVLAGSWAAVTTTGGAQGAPVTAEAVGRLLFGPWAIAVELASFLLLGAVLGARHLGRRGGPR